MKKLILAALVTCASSYALGAGNVTGKVIAVRVDQTGNGMVMFDQPVGGSPPSCVISAYNNALAFNTNTAGGKSILAMALAAKATGNSIGAYGLGTCSIFGSFVEDWDYGVVEAN